VPGARANAASWSDTRGNPWLLGGLLIGSTGNDLWAYVPEISEWVWMGGWISRTAVSAGIYGEIGIADADNVPGTRFSVASWADAEGNLWLFGGNGIDSAGNDGFLNDLWEYRFGP
jgi:hypothetical protein